jgi:hypothetical protein
MTLTERLAAAAAARRDQAQREYEEHNAFRTAEDAKWRPFGR